MSFDDKGDTAKHSVVFIFIFNISAKAKAIYRDLSFIFSKI